MNFFASEFDRNSISYLCGVSVLILFGLVAQIFAQRESEKVPVDWQTAAESSLYRKTSRYADAISYAKKLDAASEWIQYTTFGQSGEGRDLPVLIAARDGAFSPEQARKKGKAIVLIQAGIHAGEIDGKDAGFALLRDIAITKTRRDLLDDVVILFVPIYNVDGHENWSGFSRMNQNGPEESGYRANATNLNLNRDYMKADAPETRAWLRLWNQWKPDMFIDSHVTNGADFQYNITYEYPHFQEVSPAIRNWMDDHFDGKIVPKVESEGNLLTHYVEFAGREVKNGIGTFIATPRFATGYVALRNRPSLLIEAHSYKPYRTRVRGTYDVLRHTIAEVGKEKASLFIAIATAETHQLERGKTFDPKRQFPLRLGLTENSTPLSFKGIEYKTEESEISGSRRIVYGTAPMNISIPRFDEARVEKVVAPPLAYIVPKQWIQTINVIESHGIKFERLKSSTAIEVESYRLTDPKFSETSFEGRVTLTCTPVSVTELRIFPAGSIVISLEQDAADVAIHLLEPSSPDSLVYWGFFNSILEQKEYGEGYVVEKLAREMLAKDPELKREFDRKLLDPTFANNPQARLRFFYERSPYYLNQRIGSYPVGRVLDRLQLRSLAFGEK